VVEEEDKGYNLQHVDEVLKKKWLKYDEQKNVAEGQEVWEVATSVAVATCEATSMVAAEETSVKAAVTTGIMGDVRESLLDKEIELMRKLIMQQSKWRKIEIAARKINQKLNLIDRKNKMEQRTA